MDHAMTSTTLPRRAPPCRPRLPGALKLSALLLACGLPFATPVAQTASGERVAAPASRHSEFFTDSRESGSAEPSSEQATSLSASLGDHSLQAYDVSDLTNSVQAAAISLQAIHTSDFEEAQERLAQLEDIEQLRQHALGAIQALDEVVRDSIQPPLRDGTDSLRVLGDNLLVLNGSDAQHAWMIRFLETQRGADELVSMQAHVWIASQGLGRELGLNGEVQKLLPDRSQVAEVLSLAKALGHDTITSPQLLAHPRQKAMVSVLNQVSYVSEWSLVMVQPDETLIADPVIDVVQEGVVLEARAVPLFPGHWMVDAELKLSSLERPIPTRTIQFGDGSHSGKVSHPVVSKVSMSSRFAVPAGGGALFLTYDQVQDRDVLVLMQLDNFDPASLAPERSRK